MEKIDWHSLLTQAAVERIQGEAWRVVESQGEVATTAIVDTLAEQSILEGLLEASKPSLPSGTEGLHYLLSTPFRYPPLRWGSRFGTREEPSMLYGSDEIPTALAETAYYRLVLLTGMEDRNLPEPLRSQHTAFTFPYDIAAGIDLGTEIFSPYHQALLHPTSYRETQSLGATLRAQGIIGFKYLSSRCPFHGINVCLFSPAGLATLKPTSFRQVMCDTNMDRVTFTSGGELFEFDSALFLINGELPLPA